MGRELSDVFRHFIEEQRSVGMEIHFCDSLDCNNVWMQDGKLFLQLQRNWHVGFLDVLVRLEQNVMGLLVASLLLFLGSNGDCNFSCVFVVL